MSARESRSLIYARRVRIPGSVRIQLFLLTFGFISVALVIATLVIRAHTASNLTERIHEDLAPRAAMAAERLSLTDAPPDDLQTWDALADRVGELAAARVTLIRNDGVVLGDSEIALSQLPSVDSHADRDEVRQALASGIGYSVRFSGTLNINMMYIAIPWTHDGERIGVVRLALPLREVRATANTLVLQLGFAALVAIVVALVASTLTAHIGSRAARTLTDVASRMSSGDLDARSEISGSGEFAMLGNALNGLAKNLSRTLRELRAEKGRLDHVLSSMREGVLLLDDNGRVQLANAAFIEMVAPHGQVVGEKAEDLLDPRGKLLALLERARQGREATGEIELSRPHKRVLLADVRRLAGGVLAVLVDLTDQRRLETVRREFVANASHELRTPIAAISSAVETLLGPAATDPDASAHFARMISRNADRLRNLVDDLLALSRLESAETRRELEPVVLRDVVASTVSTVSAAARAKNTTLSTDVPDDLVALADFRGLEHVLGNLLDNAIKYCPNGSHVAVRTRTVPDGIEVRVSDDGPGIAAEHRERIFERFYRVDTGRSRDLGGTGLGLSIVRHWVDAMGGRVHVESTTGRGTEFCVLLKQGDPRAVGAEAEEANDDDPGR